MPVKVWKRLKNPLKKIKKSSKSVTDVTALYEVILISEMKDGFLCVPRK